ncbi:AarF/UbiB family protein [Clostridium sp. BJN0001]|uniref:ABC1 kinase family protein n=1 Tax=Clostridium sp. BJN0001 TaxID=2930219 RepID=UPI001FD13506|nr:AarF/UbiB family protein [Clostridium sp. BJN0001]
MVRYKSVKRFKEIVEVFARYGFGYIYDQNNKEDKESPSNLRCAFEKLGPTFIKIGQILSTREDILPKEYADELSKLQDRAPKEEFSSMTNVLEECLNGRDVNDEFQYINETPIASGSIAQVYEGRLKNSKEVVIKIQRPGIKSNMHIDISILIRILKFTKSRMKSDLFLFDPNGVLKEIDDSIKKELDFRIEAKNAEKFKELNKDIKYIYVPSVEKNILSEKVIVLEKINGIKIDDIDTLKKNGYDSNDIINNLLLSYCRQVFRDGFFHGDPHPGNILINNNKICFVDFGIMGVLSPYLKKWLNDVIVSAAFRDKIKLTESILSIGIKRGKVNKADLYDSISYIFDTYMCSSINNIKISVILREIIDIGKKNNMQFPNELICLVRALILLEGLVAKTAPNTEIINVLMNYIRTENHDIILKNAISEDTLLQFYSFLRDSMRISPKILEVLIKASAGKSRININIEEMRDLLSEVGKMVNRITIGVLTAAFILSSSLIVSFNVKPLYKGVSIFGILGYIISTLLTIVLLISIIKSRKIKDDKK